MSDPAGNGMMLALLAAGQSRRFGDDDKLTALLRGKMLGLHAAESLAALDDVHHMVIASSADHPCVSHWQELGYDIIVNERAADGQSTSVQSAVDQAIAGKASGLAICLADMPYVTQPHVENLLAAFRDLKQQQIVASSDHGSAMPPAIFPPSQFSALADLQGDQGARKLLQTAHLVPAPEGSLLDIDSPDVLLQENH